MHVFYFPLIVSSLYVVLCSGLSLVSFRLSDLFHFLAFNIIDQLQRRRGELMQEEANKIRGKKLYNEDKVGGSLIMGTNRRNRDDCCFPCEC